MKLSYDDHSILWKCCNWICKNKILNFQYSVQVSFYIYVIFSVNWIKKYKIRIIFILHLPKMNFCFLEYNYCQRDSNILRSRVCVTENTELQLYTKFALVKWMLIKYLRYLSKFLSSDSNLQIASNRIIGHYHWSKTLG